MPRESGSIDSDTFQRERPRLIGLAYRMLGSVSEAEDVVQEAYIRWHKSQSVEIQDAGAFLTTITARLALDALRKRKRDQDRYVGPWLPEPLPLPSNTTPPETPEERLAIADDLTIATLLILEELTPEERAAFLLHDVFDVPYDKISELTGTTNAAARQHASRARRRLKSSESPPAPPREKRDEMVGEFMRCFASGDLDRLTTLLTEDVRLISDGGAKGRAALRPCIGRADVMSLLKGLLWRWGATFKDAHIQSVELNRSPGFLVAESEDGPMAITLELSTDGIRRIFILRNPDKLTHLTK